MRTGGEQSRRLAEADLVAGGSCVEEDGTGSRPQTLAFADDRGRIGAVDLAAQQRAGEGEAGVERRDLGVGIKLGRELVERGFEFGEVVDIQQSQQYGPDTADAGAENLVEILGDRLLIGIEAQCRREVDGKDEV